jgi:hypothetical protein
VLWVLIWLGLFLGSALTFLLCLRSLWNRVTAVAREAETALTRLDVALHHSEQEEYVESRADLLDDPIRLRNRVDRLRRERRRRVHVIRQNRISQIRLPIDT